MSTFDANFEDRADGSHFVRFVDSYSDGWLEYETTQSVHLKDWE